MLHWLGIVHTSRGFFRVGGEGLVKDHGPYKFSNFCIVKRPRGEGGVWEF